MITEDEAKIFESVKSIEWSYWTYWYHWLTSTIYTVILETFHKESSVVLVQMILVSTSFAYIFMRLKELLKTKLSFFLIIPFILLPVINASLLPARSTLWGFLMFHFIALVYIKIVSDSDITRKNIFISAITTSILICWRSEGLPFLFLIQIGLYWIFKSKITKRQSLIYILTMLIFTFSIAAIQTKGQLSSKYTVLPLTFEIERMFTRYENLKTSGNDIQILKKYINIENFSSDNYNADAVAGEAGNKEFYLVMGRLIKNNFKEFIKSKFIVMKDSKSMHGAIENKWDEGIRKTVICKLEVAKEECKSVNKYKFLNKLYSTEYLIYILAFIWIFAFISKNKFYYFVSTLLSSNFLIVFFFAPVSFFDYYFSVYLSSIFFFLLFIISYISKKYLLTK